MLRPEFPASRDHEHETLQLVKDVADTFDQISAGPTHTPSLYSSFLRALLASKTEPPSETASDSGENDAVSNVNGNPDQRQVGAAESYHPQLLSEFHFASEMGPVADMSTFPPTMAAAHPSDSLGLLSMDSILSGGFWDNVLVPGEFVRFDVSSQTVRPTSSYRLLKPYGRNQWGLCVWHWGARLYRAPL
jgi:hypothetical protein